MLKVEVILSACLCAYPAARDIIMTPHCVGTVPRLTKKVYNLLREGNHMNVPVTAAREVSIRPHVSHLDMPSYFNLLPFHYVNSSALVEAWFAAPTVAQRRSLIDWPDTLDASSLHRFPITKIWSFDEIPEEFYRRTGGGVKHIPRLQLHPSIQFIYDLIKKARLHENIRITWRVRFKLLLDNATSTLAKQCTRRRLILSLIFGDTRDVHNHHPPGTVRPYSITATVADITCVPVGLRDITVSHLPGHSLPVVGGDAHPPRIDCFDGVRVQVAAYRAARDTAPPLTTPDDLLRLAHTAMAESATVWARLIIAATRDPDCPDPSHFPTLEQPATSVSDDLDAYFPLARPVVYFSDDEDAPDAPQPLPDDDD